MDLQGLSLSKDQDKAKKKALSLVYFRSYKQDLCPSKWFLFSQKFIVLSPDYLILFPCESIK